MRYRKGGRHDATLDAALVRERLVNEDHLQHACRVDEADEIALGDGAVEGAELEADLEVIPIVAVADRLHESGFSLRALLSMATPTSQRQSSARLPAPAAALRWLPALQRSGPPR
jgi:hypothetical protein